VRTDTENTENTLSHSDRSLNMQRNPSSHPSGLHPTPLFKRWLITKGNQRSIITLRHRRGYCVASCFQSCIVTSPIAATGMVASWRLPRGRDGRKKTPRIPEQFAIMREQLTLGGLGKLSVSRRVLRRRFVPNRFAQRGKTRKKRARNAQPAR